MRVFLWHPGQTQLAALWLAALLAACSPDAPATQNASPPVSTENIPPPEDGYGAYYASPERLAEADATAIANSMRLNVTAMTLGRAVYEKNCASCHGADLKGSAAMHAPDLTDDVWKFSGDDLASGGADHFPSDIEWLVRYGIRSGHKDALGLDADMPALDPQYRSREDKEKYGDNRFLSAEEIGDVVEYVLQIGGQAADAAKAKRGDALFHDGDKGNCNDCHGENGEGDAAIGSTNLRAPRLYLFGADRASILESVTRGRRGTMPAFDAKLTPADIKAVTVYVFNSGPRK